MQQEVIKEVIQFATNHSYLALAWVGLFTAIIFMTIKLCFSKVKEISCVEATHLINRENATVVDSRSRDEFRKGHIIESIHLVASEIKNGNLGELDKHRLANIIVICANGTASRELAERLYTLGFVRTYFLKGGIANWNEQNLPLVAHKNK